MHIPAQPSPPLSADLARSPLVPEAAVPWWRVGVMWLVVGGPGVVVVASFALLATAVRQADTVVPHAVGRNVIGTGTPSAPALQARNYLTTPPVRALDAPAAPASAP